MSLKSSSKHGILVATVTVLTSLLVILTEISLVRYLVTADEVYDIGIIFLLQHVGTFILALLAAVSSLLMIWGIVKKSHTLIVPWMTLYSLAAVLFTVKSWYDTVLQIHQFDDILFCLIIMGFEIIVIYPIYILHADIRIANAEHIGDDESYYGQNVKQYSDPVCPKTIL